MCGDFGLANLAAAIGVLGAAGQSLDAIAAVVADLPPVPGRMEFVRRRGRPSVVVDYAHTPDALAKALSALRPHCRGRLICVLGCGGDRDAGKRPIMAQATVALADRVWFTSDNPRSEDPAAIIAAMLAGLSDASKVTVEVDRAAAIRAAIAYAGADDLVMVAGKGPRDAPGGARRETAVQRSGIGAPGAGDARAGAVLMALWLTEYLAQFVSVFSVFQYLTFRTMVSVVTALAVSLLIGPFVIKWLDRSQIGQSVRDDGPRSHLPKAGTPTMGGALILIVIIATTLLWGDLGNRYVWTLLLVILAFGGIGWLDDYLKVRRRDSKGLPARWKFAWQSVFGLATALFLYSSAAGPAETDLIVPFFKSVALPLGVGFVLVAYLVIVGMSNAVNLTDGLDGLAILPTVMVGAGLGLIAYLVGHVEFATYLQIPHVPLAGEVAVFCGALVGAGLGFLWFNAYPAEVFMGDVGALALGAALAVVAIIVRHEIVLFIMGGLFVLEAASVIVQVFSFRLTGRRIFRMAPIHHHFELKGWPEPRVIVRFWIVTLVLVIIGLSTLKLR